MPPQPQDSLNHSMDKAKKHYSSLFFLPSFKKALIATTIICVVGVNLTAFALFPAINSIMLGFGLLVVTVTADLIVSKILLRDDPLFNMRRTSAMSMYNWLLWLAFLALGTALGYFFEPSLWVKLALIGFGAVTTLRTIVLMATSFSTKFQQALSAFLQPILCVGLLIAFWTLTINIAIQQVLIYVILTSIIAYLAVYLFLHSIDSLGKSSYGLPAMAFFKAFILNWVTDANEPLEKHLEEVGQNADIEVNLLKFDAEKPKAAIIVPLVHPGPFKNIGSSLLPSMLKHDYEKKYGSTACIPLGILGHELDLASQTQNHKIVSEILSQAKFQTSNTNASPYVRATSGYVTASCQIFGDTAFLSFTLAPKTTEDLPQELGHMVTEEAKRYGLKHAVVVNAHNALDDEFANMNEHLTDLKTAAIDSIKKATSLPTKPFKVGAATIYPTDITQKMGLGTGGITAIVIGVEKQKNAYIIIDGNNMVPHLREKIIDSLSTIGFDESDVFTTDTHAVSALVTGRRGYHPIGEAINHDLLISYIRNVAKDATQNSEYSKAGSIQFVIPQIRVIGEERINSISLLIDKAINRAKKIAPAIFGAEGLLLILMLSLF